LGSHYDDTLNELKENGEKLANQYIIDLYNILRDEEKLRTEDCRAKIEHDCLDLWSKSTIRKYLPVEARDPKKQIAGRIGGESKKNKSKNAMLVFAIAGTESENGTRTGLEESCPVSQSEQDSARTNLAENDSLIQKEQESSTFHTQLNEKLSNRIPSSELLEATKIIADKDRRIEELEKDREELLKENPIRDFSIILFLPNNLAMGIYNAVRYNIMSSSTTITGFNLEHDGQEVTAVYLLKGGGEE